MLKDWLDDVAKAKIALAYEGRNHWKRKALRYEFVIQALVKAIRSYESEKDAGNRSELGVTLLWADEVIAQEKD